MEKLNIPLKGAINTESNGLTRQEPTYEKKNSLVFKGIASNTRVSSGTGILSTTGKQLEIKDNVLYADGIPYNVDTEWVLEESSTYNKTDDEAVYIKDGNLYLVSGDKKSGLVHFRGETNLDDLTLNHQDLDELKIVPIQDESQGPTSLFIVYLKDNTTYCQFIDGSSTRFYELSNSKTFGKTWTACRIKLGNYTIEALGSDDEDFRKRYSYIFVNSDSIFRIDGMGLIDSNGFITGEPYLRHRYFGPFEGVAPLNSTLDENLRGTTISNPLGVQLGLLSSNNIAEDARFKILPNGVISAWTGAFNPNYKSCEISKNNKTFLELIADENASLGASLESKSGTQEGLSGWHWKIHNIISGSDWHHPLGIENEEDFNYYGTNWRSTLVEGSNMANFLRMAEVFPNKAGEQWVNWGCGAYIEINGKKIAISRILNDTCYTGYQYIPISSNESYTLWWATDCSKININDDYDQDLLYGVQTKDTSEAYRVRYDSNTFQNEGWEWVLAIDLRYLLKGTTIGKPIVQTFLDSGSYADSFITDECDSSRAFPYWANVIGDYSYLFDSMKSYKDLTDYDSVFPNLRMFFNNTNAKGKYWDYGKGWSSFYRYTSGAAKFGKELLYLQKPVVIGHLKSNYGTWNDNKDQFSLKYSLVNNWSIGSKLDFKSLNTDLKTKTSGSFMPDILDSFYHCKVVGNDDEGFSDSNYFWRANKWDYLYAFPNIRSQTNANGEAKESYSDALAPFDCWLATSNFGTRATGWYEGSNLFRKLKILGDGEGIAEPTSSIGRFGDNALVDITNYTIPLIDNEVISNYNYYETAWENNDLLRLGIYQGIPMALTFKGTLLFNATDLGTDYTCWKDSDSYNVIIYNGKKVQFAKIKHNGTLKIDKLTDYMFRLNTLSGENLILESREGLFSVIKGFNGFIGEEQINASYYDIGIGGDDIGSNNEIYYASGINSDLLDENSQPSFLFPAKTISSYVLPADVEKFGKEVLDNRNSVIVNRFRMGGWKDKLDVYYASSNISTDISYKFSSKLPENQEKTLENQLGVQTYDSSKTDTTYWIDSETVIYPAAISSSVSNTNYLTSTIDLPDNYSVRFYNQNNKVWAVYNELAQVYYGKSIFTIMGSNYYFDGQGIYFLGNSQTGTATGQYSENILIAYAVGMEFLCNAPSEAYFYSPFDKCLYIFTSSNTMQKSTSLQKFGKPIDFCYCPVNQSLYLLFDGKLIIKSQDDMAILDVEGDTLQTTTKGVQVIKEGQSYEIHSPDSFEEFEPLEIETDWLGEEDSLTKYSFVDVVFQKLDENPTIEVDLLTRAGLDVVHTPSKITIKDWQNGLYRVRLTPKEPVGNAFKIIIKSEDLVGCYNICVYLEKASLINSAGGWR